MANQTKKQTNQTVEKPDPRSEEIGQYAWRGWSYAWNAESGRHYLCVRATDTEGNMQPTAQPWTLHGMGNNMIQRVDVIVE